MDGLVFEILSHVGQQHLDLLDRPSQGLGEDGLGDAVGDLEKVLLLHGADDLVLPAPRPRIDGHREPLLGDVDEAGVGDEFPEIQRREGFPPDFPDS